MLFFQDKSTIISRFHTSKYFSFFSENRNMIKAKKILALIAIPLIYIWHCSAKEMSAEQAQQTRAKIVATAKKYIGCSYQIGAIGPEKFDCSGFVFTVMREAASIQLPRSAKTIYSKVKIIKSSEVEEGDLVFFKTTGNGSISHVGIYIGKNQFIHAASEGSNTGVIISSLKEKYYANTFAGVGQVLPSGKKSNDAEDNEETVIEESMDEFSMEHSAPTSNSSGKWYTKLIFDSTLFCDWNFFLPNKLMLNWRGIALEANARYAGWALQPGIGTIFRYNNGTDNFQVPIVFSLTFSDYIKIYAGPVINFGTPKLPDSNKRISGSFFPGIIGISFQTPSIKAGKILLSFVQDFEYTVFDNKDGSALSLGDSIGTGVVFSTGIRVTLPGSNIFK